MSARFPGVLEEMKYTDSGCFCWRKIETSTYVIVPWLWRVYTVSALSYVK